MLIAERRGSDKMLNLDKMAFGPQFANKSKAEAENGTTRTT
jgi:hypothetical protein